MLTGYQRRTYPIMSESDDVIVGGNAIPLQRLAATFQPQLVHRVGDFSPPALIMWWEAIDAGNDIVLIYHPVWQDERHPAPLLHWIYYVYRAIVYGIPVRDIEYIQININRSSGSIQKIRYEDSTASAYDQPFAQHVQIIIERSGADFKETARLQNSSLRVKNIRLSGPALTFAIATWSHQLVLLENGGGIYTVPVPMPLEHLKEGDYVKHKLARRSQGDFETQEGMIGRAAKRVVQTLFLGLPHLISKVSHGRAVS